MEKSDIIYILKDTPTNEELRYSLRSLANFPHNRVVFVGGKPYGLKPDIWISHKQKTNRKWGNARDLIELACNDNRLTPDVYLFNDDFFVIKPITTLKVYKNHTLQELSKLVSRKGYSEYAEIRINPTIQELEKHNLPTTNYELHLPMKINRQKMLEIYKKFPLAAKRSCYGNYYNIGGENIDLKMNDGSVQSPKDSLNPKRTFISTTDESWEGVVGKQLQQMFPVASRYET